MFYALSKIIESDIACNLLKVEQINCLMTVYWNFYTQVNCKIILKYGISNQSIEIITKGLNYL